MSPLKFLPEFDGVRFRTIEMYVGIDASKMKRTAYTDESSDQCLNPTMHSIVVVCRPCVACVLSAVLY